MSAISPGTNGLSRMDILADPNLDHLRGMTFEEMRAASPLPRDSQMLIDQAVIRTGTDRLSVTADLIAEGLTYPLPNPLSVTEIYWESVSKTGGAFRTMSPEARGEYQLPARSPYRIPVYLTMDDFSLNIRTLLMSQRVGAPLDTTLVEEATRRVNEAIEDSVINGAGLQVGGNTAPGLLNAPNANTYTLGGNWTTRTGQQIVDDMLGMLTVMSGAGIRRFGPYNLYVPTAYGITLNRYFSDGVTTFPTTILSQIQQMQVGGRGINVRVADMLPANTVVLVQMSRDVIDIVDGQRPTVVPWTSPSGFTLFWTVMAVMIPRVKTDFDETSGIMIATL
jgi:uncharacterized linocin/CFP29 family protein